VIFELKDAAPRQHVLVAVLLGIQAVTRRNAENPLIGLDQQLFRQNLLCELDDAAPFVWLQIIRLVENEEHTSRLRPQAMKVVKFDLGDRRIG
jgi:hypothetical protein